MLRLLSLWAPVALYMTLLFSLSARSDVAPPARLSDKAAHALAYMGLAVVSTRAVAGGLPARITGRIAVLGAAIAIGYGATDEFHQLYVPGRFGDLNDLLADAVGAAVGVAACWAWGILRFRLAD